MISRAQIKYIRSLGLQKNRKASGHYLVEGDKLGLEWLNSGKNIELIAATSGWILKNSELIAKHPEATVLTATEAQLDEAGTLKNAHESILVVKQEAPGSFSGFKSGWTIVLDHIQDPGNMGTIIRIADWFGIRSVIASEESVEFFNPKVLQSAMGGHLRVALFRADLEKALSKNKIPVFAATLQGKNIYELNKSKDGILLIGNESNGISKSLLSFADQQVTIPRFGKAESLNAAVATGILCSSLMAH